jgi:hypothetical protein
MMRHSADTRAAQQRAALASTAAASGTSGSVGSAQHERVTSSAADELFGGVSHAERLQLELVIRSAEDQDSALEAVISCIVGDENPRKCAAIASAFRTNAALLQQWQATWRELRS